MRTARRFRVPRLATVVTVVVLLALYAPIASVFVNSFNADARLATWGGATAHWWSDAFGDERVRSALRDSAVVAGWTTVLSLVLATSATVWWRRASPRSRRLLDATTFLRLVLPEVVLALGLFLVFQMLELPLGTTAVVVGQVVWCSAYATVVLQARAATFGTGLDDAAADLGANGFRTFVRVVLPVLAPGVAAAALLVLSFSLDDVVTSQFLGGTDTETLPVLVLGKIRLTVSPEVNAIGAASMLLTAVPTVVLLLSGRTPVPGAAGRTTRKETS